MSTGRTLPKERLTIKILVIKFKNVHTLLNSHTLSAYFYIHLILESMKSELLPAKYGSLIQPNNGAPGILFYILYHFI